MTVITKGLKFFYWVFPRFVKPLVFGMMDMQSRFFITTESTSKIISVKHIQSLFLPEWILKFFRVSH